ncbi:hypothetical protein PHLCEN_2v4379 [Hermanssonia centrifuga]|uniref:Uncharacterized protein n=1 Tax=Hermanssonia centrifuga TaxID=98765 RepID=A0A2R6PVF2_9APHY|nr:hypothetical protein PHLCEN_2v4379 [Hermanssonia centrifuga]
MPPSQNSEVYNFLTSAPAEFKRKSPQGGDQNRSTNTYLDVPPPRTKGSTHLWSSRILRGVRLGMDPDAEWKEEKENFLQDARSWKPLHLPVTPIPFDYPRTEDDVVLAFELQVAIPILQIANANKWVPHPVGKMSNVRWDLALLGEAYSKTPEDPSLSGEKLPGVRVDKLFVLSPFLREGAESRQYVAAERFRQQQATKADESGVRGANGYLREDTIWGFAEGSLDDSTASLKGLLPLECKNLNALKKDLFEWLAAHRIPLDDTAERVITLALAKSTQSGPNRPRPTKQALLGTISMLQQALRYGRHYGVPRVMLTDYFSAVVIDTHLQSNVEAPSGTAASEGEHKRPLGQEHKPNVVTSLNWFFVEKEDLRATVAYYLRSALSKVRKLLDDNVKAQEAGKPEY